MKEVLKKVWPTIFEIFFIVFKKCKDTFIYSFFISLTSAPCFLAGKIRSCKSQIEIAFFIVYELSPEEQILQIRGHLRVLVYIL